MARSGSGSTSGGDGSAPAIGEIVSEASGGRPRTPRRGDQTAGLALDGTRSPETAARNAEAIAAQAAHNSGASASDGAGPVCDPGGLLSGGTSRPVAGRTGSADPSSLG